MPCLGNIQTERGALRKGFLQGACINRPPGVGYVRMRFRLLFLLAAGMAGQAAASVWNDLDPAQRQSVKGGKQVLIEEAVEGQPWPRARVYRVVNASPEQVAAVFFDYAEAKTYIPDVLSSRVNQLVSPCVAEVEYEVDVPILSDEVYVARNELRQLPDETYEISWTLLRALQTKAAKGNLHIEPFGEKSIIRYTNLVTPGSGMAGLLRHLAMGRMEQTVEAIGRKAESQRKSHPAALASQVEKLREALASSGNRECGDN